MHSKCMIMHYYLFFIKILSHKGRGQKKNLEFSRFGQTHPQLKIAKIWKKNQKFYHPKMIFRQFWAVWEKIIFLIFSPYKIKRGAADMMHNAAKMMDGVANMMGGAADMIGVQLTQCSRHNA